MANFRQKSIEVLQDEKRAFKLQRRRLFLRSLWWASVLPGLMGLLFVCLLHYCIPAGSWIRELGVVAIAGISMISFAIAYPILMQACKIGEQIRQIDWEVEEKEGLRHVENVTAKISSGDLRPNPHVG